MVFLISCFIEDILRIGQKLHKTTNNSIENMGSTPILTDFVGVHPRNIHTKFEANTCSGSREEVKNGISRSHIQLKYGYEGYRQFPLPRAQVYFQRRSRGK